MRSSSAAAWSASSNALNGEFQGTARLAAIRWETEFYKAHSTFQAQIPEAAECDLVFAIFRSRLGSTLPGDFPRMENGESYPSGTAYELLSAIDAAKGRGLPDVYVFRCPQPPSVQLDDPGRAEIEAQWERLKAFFETWFRTEDGQFKAAFQTFKSTDDFEAQAEALLRKWLEDKVLKGRAVVWPVALKGSPFRGLAAFGVKHAPVFFGRSRDTAKAVERLKDAAEKGCPFLLVDGASGAGKSSLVRAGLVPRLTAAGVVPKIDLWRVAVMRPSEAGGDPFAALARALFVRTEDLPEYEGGRAAALPELGAGDFRRPEDFSAQLVHADETSLKPIIATLDAVARAARQTSGYDRDLNAALLLVIDQLDELFDADMAPEQRARFARLIDLLARCGRVWVIATLRGGLIEELLAQPELKQLKEDGASYDLAPPDAAGLAEIVRGPAAAAGLFFEKDDSGETLDERLLNDADRPDLLPLLQFTLNQLFETAKTTNHPNILTFTAYRAFGGLEGAVDKEAEAALKNLGKAELAQLPRLLRELAAPAVDSGFAVSRGAFDIRSVPLAVAAHDKASSRLVRALVDARILLASGDGGTATVRLAHARVLDCWQRAKTIVTENAEFYRIRSDVEQQRRRWETAKRSRSLLISRGRPLKEAKGILHRFPDEIPASARDFIRRSRWKARRAQIFVGWAVVLFVAMVSFVVWLTEGDALDALKLAGGLGKMVGAMTSDAVFIGVVQRGDLQKYNGDLAGALKSYTDDVAVFEMLSKSDPDNRNWRRSKSAALNKVGEVQLAQNDFAGALKSYQDSLAIIEPLVQSNPVSDRLQALLAEDFGKIDDLQTLLAETYLKLGTTYRHLGEHDNALDVLQKAKTILGRLMKLAPDNILLKSHMADLNKEFELNDSAYVNGRCLADQASDSPDHIIADCDEAIRLDSNNALTFHQRGHAYEIKKDYDRALSDYSQAIRLNLQYVDAFIGRGNVYDAKKDYELAISNYDQAIRLNPNYAFAYFLRGDAYHAKRDYDRAIPDYDEAIRRDPTNFLAFYNRGLTHRARNDFSAAVADFTDVVRVQPKFIYGYTNRGLTYLILKDYDRAIADFDEANRLDPDDIDSLDWSCRTRAAAGRDLQKALADCDKSLRLAPDVAGVLNSRGLVQLKLGAFAQAIADYGAAVARNPKDAGSLLGRGVAKVKSGDFSGGLADIVAAKAIDPDIAETYADYGIE